MCFSAEASFTASAAIAIIGALNLRAAWVFDKRYVPMASITVLFALHQGLEGVVWLTGGKGWGAVCGYLYLLTGNALWPLMAPLSAWLVESDALRKKLIFWLIPLGIGVSAYGIYVLTYPLTVSINYHHVVYVLGTPPSRWFMLTYIIAVSVPLMLMKNYRFALLGFMILAEFPLALLAFTVSFASVWCFFTALTSTMLLWCLTSERRRIQAANAITS